MSALPPSLVQSALDALMNAASAEAVDIGVGSIVVKIHGVEDSVAGHLTTLISERVDMFLATAAWKLKATKVQSALFVDELPKLARGVRPVRTSYTRVAVATTHFAAFSLGANSITDKEGRSDADCLWHGAARVAAEKRGDGLHPLFRILYLHKGHSLNLDSLLTSGPADWGSNYAGFLHRSLERLGIHSVPDARASFVHPTSNWFTIIAWDAGMFDDALSMFRRYIRLKKLAVTRNATLVPGQCETKATFLESLRAFLTPTMPD